MTTPKNEAPPPRCAMRHDLFVVGAECPLCGYQKSHAPPPPEVPAGAPHDKDEKIARLIEELYQTRLDRTEARSRAEAAEKRAETAEDMGEKRRRLLKAANERHARFEADRDALVAKLRSEALQEAETGIIERFTKRDAADRVAALGSGDATGEAMARKEEDK